ncbi:hypothetical protein [Micromonospora sp. NPDC000442]|uniref:hypothetical protein n=1 Tax=Micromonospora sp. NPDC000442 TaxID=3364217 RepID=UPI0036B62243
MESTRSAPTSPRRRGRRGTGRGKQFRPSAPTSAQQAMLAALYGSAATRDRLRLMAKAHGDVSDGGFARQLRAMVRAGVVHVEQCGGQLLYRLDERHQK